MAKYKLLLGLTASMLSTCPLCAEATNGQWYATSFTLPGKSMYPGTFPVEFDAYNRLVLPKSVGVPFDEKMARQKESSYQ